MQPPTRGCDSLSPQGRGLIEVGLVVSAAARTVGTAERTTGVIGRAVAVAGMAFGLGGSVLITTGVGVAVGTTIPASARGRSRTTASNVGSGVGWRIAARSAVVARGVPPPQATHKSTDVANPMANRRESMKARISC